MAKVIIPTPLRKFTENQSTIETNGGTVLESIQHIATQYPDLKKHLFDDEGEIRNFVRLYVGDDDIEDLQSVATKVEGGTVISIVPAIAGGTY